MEERVGVRQIQGESKRRWFASDDFDLIVWLSDDERLIAFELCYDKRGKERSIRWSNSGGYLHMAVDNGEQVLGKHKETPILIADGLFDSKQVHSNLSEVKHLLPDEIAEYVLTAIGQYPREFTDRPAAAKE